MASHTTFYIVSYKHNQYCTSKEYHTNTRVLNWSFKV